MTCVFVVTTGTAWGRNLGARDKYATTSRRAAATLTEAREMAHDLVGNYYANRPLDAHWNAAHNAVADIEDAGGVVRLLDDEAVVEVKPVTIEALRASIDRCGVDCTDAEDIAAFNALPLH